MISLTQFMHVDHILPTASDFDLIREEDDAQEATRELARLAQSLLKKLPKRFSYGLILAYDPASSEIFVQSKGRASLTKENAEQIIESFPLILLDTEANGPVDKKGKKAKKTTKPKK